MLANDFPLGIFSTPNQGKMMSGNLAGPEIYFNSSDAICTVRYTIPFIIDYRCRLIKERLTKICIHSPVW